MPLLLAIESGETLVTAHGEHKKTFIDIELSRMYQAYAEALRNGMPDFGIDTVMPEFDRDMYASNLFDTLADVTVPMWAACSLLIKEKWPEELVKAHTTYVETIRNDWCTNWNVNMPEFASDYDEIQYVFAKVHSRYAAYMMLKHGEAPDPLNFPLDTDPPRYEYEMFENSPPLMQVMYAMYVPQRIDSMIRWVKEKEGPKVLMTRPSRKRGTPWDTASEETRRVEIRTLKRSLKLPCLSSVSSKILTTIENALNEVIVETRYKAQNSIKKERSEANKKRAEAPSLRYYHPDFTKDVLNMVLNLQGKKENPHEDKAPSRVSCVCCLLYLHDVPFESWVQSQNFPKPIKM